MGEDDSAKEFLVSLIHVYGRQSGRDACLLRVWSYVEYVVLSCGLRAWAIVVFEMSPAP